MFFFGRAWTCPDFFRVFTETAKAPAAGEWMAAASPTMIEQWVIDKRSPKWNTSTDGFTLIEVLVAFAIAALILGAMYDILASDLRSEGTTESYRNAVLIGQSALDAVAIVPTSPGESFDRVGIYEREIRITERPELKPAKALTDALPYQIEVRVSWREGTRQRRIDLVTLRLAPPPQP
jgi:general secretion pathway protein I